MLDRSESSRRLPRVRYQDPVRERFRCGEAALPGLESAQAMLKDRFLLKTPLEICNALLAI